MLCPLRLDIEAIDPGDALAAVSPDLIKQHAVIEDATEDDLITAYLLSAIEWAESETKRTIIRRSHTWVLKDFGSAYDRAIRLPRGRVASVESVDYSVSGAYVTLYGPTSDVSPVGDDYQEDLWSDAGGVLMPPRGIDWPSVDMDVPAPVVIRFTAGYAADAIPPQIKHALLFYVLDCYDLRGSRDIDASSVAMTGQRTTAREALISAWRLPRIY